MEMGWGRASETPETQTRPNVPRWAKLPVVERETCIAEVSKKTWPWLVGMKKTFFKQPCSGNHCVRVHACCVWEGWWRGVTSGWMQRQGNS